MATCAPEDVRPALPEDRGPLAEVLARAFHDDPMTSWLYPDARRRMGHARRFFEIRLRQLAGHGLIHTTPERSGAALWAPPGRWREDLRQSLMLLPMLPILLPRLVSTARGVREIERHHPPAPHYYLSVLGTDPEHQGQGIGSVLLAPVLRRCDETRTAAYLESSKESNLAFYARHGFALTQRIELPGGPPLWLMWREPPARGAPSLDQAQQARPRAVSFSRPSRPTASAAASLGADCVKGTTTNSKSVTPAARIRRSKAPYTAPAASVRAWTVNRQNCFAKTDAKAR